MPARTPRRIRIAHVMYAFHRGGMETGIVKVVNGLPHAKFQHAIVALTTVGVMWNEIRAPGASHVEVRKREGKDPAATVRLIRALAAFRPHVLRTYCWSAWFDGVLARHVLRIPVHIHSEHGQNFEQTPAQRRRRLRLQPLLGGLTDALIAMSADIKRDLVRSGVAARRIHVVYNGVDRRRFFPADEQRRARARALLGLNPHERVVGSVGRLVMEKDYSTLLHAMARLSDMPSLRVVIVGEGPERQLLERCIAEQGLQKRVQLVGERNDVPDLLPAFDLFVLPSVSEGLSNTLLEAMATGLPVVSTTVGGTPEIVRHGVDGLLVPPRQPVALAQAVRAVLTDPGVRQRLVQGALARIADRFSLQAMLRGYAQLLTSVLARRSPALRSLVGERSPCAASQG